MRIVIAYTSRSGSTATVARWMEDELRSAGHHVESIDASKESSLSGECDLLIAGCPVRLERTDTTLKTFLESNREQLEGVPKALFVVCMFLWRGRSYLSQLREAVDPPVVALRAFGGRLGPFNRLDEGYVRQASRNIVHLAEKAADSGTSQ